MRVILISSLTLSKRIPRSGSLRVTCRISSSKHSAKRTSRTGQMPISLACLSINRWSSCSLNLATSTLEAAVWLTYSIYYLWSRVHSLGGKIAFNISSLLGLTSIGGSCYLLVPKFLFVGSSDISVGGSCYRRLCAGPIGVLLKPISFIIFLKLLKILEIEWWNFEEFGIKLKCQ